MRKVGFQYQTTTVENVRKRVLEPERLSMWPKLIVDLGAGSEVLIVSTKLNLGILRIFGRAENRCKQPFIKI